MTANPNLFKKYKSDIFYESGTYYGDSVKAALDAGFERIVSTEIFEPIFNKTRVLFEGNQFVSCVHGDSVTVLKNVLPTFHGKKLHFGLMAIIVVPVQAVKILGQSLKNLKQSLQQRIVAIFQDQSF